MYFSFITVAKHTQLESKENTHIYSYKWWEKGQWGKHSKYAANPGIYIYMYTKTHAGIGKWGLGCIPD